MENTLNAEKSNKTERISVYNNTTLIFFYMSQFFYPI